MHLVNSNCQPFDVEVIVPCGEEDAAGTSSRAPYSPIQGRECGAARRRMQSLTFRIDPVCVAVGQRGAVTELLNRLRGLVVDLEDGTRPPPTSRILFRHLVYTPSTRRIGARVVGDGALEEDWGRQLAGVAGSRGERRFERPARWADGRLGGERASCRVNLSIQGGRWSIRMLMRCLCRARRTDARWCVCRSG